MATKKKPAPRPDPAFEAIDNHKNADKAFLAAAAALRRAGLTALRRDYERASDAEDNAAWKLARTKATTAAGASALLTYIATEPITGLFELGETDWHETAFRTVVASLAKITQRAA
jgi:hypothetical protein